MKKKILTLLITLLLAINSFSQQATHLNFDGNNDYVAIANPYTSFTNAISVEFWINPAINMAVGSGIGQGTAGLDIMSDNVWLVHGNGNGTFTFYVNDNGTWKAASGTLTLHTWQHFSCVADASGVKVYKNGLLVNSSPNGIINGIRSNPTAELHIGKDVRYPTAAGRNCNASFDDVRIFNFALDAEQVNGSKNCELQGTETGLVGYYKFNQGVDASTNSSETTLNATTGSNGILNNFALTGATSNWLATSPVTTGSIVPSVATVTSPVVYNQGATASALTATTGTNGSGLLWYTAATSGTGNATPYTPSTATTGNTSYWVSSTNANGCESARTQIVVRVNGAGTHLNFDGANDFVSLSATPTNIPAGNSNYTLEAWIKPSQLGAKGIIGLGNYGTTNNVNALRLTPSGIVNYWWANDLSVNYTFNLDTWYHVAATYNGTTRSIYINGSLVGSDVPAAASHNVTTTSNVTIGRTWNNEYFSGSLDEVRIWNKALTATDITNTMNCELQSNETGLVAYYKFNQGFDNANNAGITTLTDASGNANNGTLTNFALSGATSNWLAGSPVITGNTCTTLNASNFEVSSKLKMYPNPANDVITIDISDLTNAKLQVLDITGKVLMNNTLNSNSNSINVSQLPKGIYLFKVETLEGSFTNKIIKN